MKFLGTIFMIGILVTPTKINACSSTNAGALQYHAPSAPAQNCEAPRFLPTLNLSANDWRSEHHKHVPLYISAANYKNPQDNDRGIRNSINLDVNSALGHVGKYKSRFTVQTTLDDGVSVTPAIHFSTKDTVIEAGYNTDDGFMFRLTDKF